MSQGSCGEIGDHEVVRRGGGGPRVCNCQPPDRKERERERSRVERIRSGEVVVSEPEDERSMSRREREGEAAN